MPNRRVRRPVNISFRLDSGNAEALEQLAREAEASRHECARGLVLDALCGTGALDRLSRRVEATDDQVRNLRRDLAGTLLALLTDPPGARPPETVREWLRRNGFLLT